MKLVDVYLLALFEIQSVKIDSIVESKTGTKIVFHTFDSTFLRHATAVFIEFVRPKAGIASFRHQGWPLLAHLRQQLSTQHRHIESRATTKGRVGVVVVSHLFRSSFVLPEPMNVPCLLSREFMDTLLTITNATWPDQRQHVIIELIVERAHFWFGRWTSSRRRSGRFGVATQPKPANINKQKQRKDAPSKHRSK